MKLVVFIFKHESHTKCITFTFETMFLFDSLNSFHIIRKAFQPDLLYMLFSTFLLNFFHIFSFFYLFMRISY